MVTRKTSILHGLDTSTPSVKVRHHPFDFCGYPFSFLFRLRLFLMSLYFSILGSLPFSLSLSTTPTDKTKGNRTFKIEGQEVRTDLNDEDPSYSVVTYGVQSRQIKRSQTYPKILNGGFQKLKPVKKNLSH